MMRVFRFCSLSSFLPSWFCGWLLWCFDSGLLVGVCLAGFSLLVFLPLFVVLGLWLLVFLVVRRVFFVRFPCPGLFGWWRSSLWSWFCVPAGSLASLRAVCPVWSVRPAVVCRRSGVVLVFWCLACPAACEDTDTTNLRLVGASFRFAVGAAAVAAAPAFT